jgi:hypothetical protein
MENGNGKLEIRGLRICIKGAASSLFLTGKSIDNCSVLRRVAPFRQLGLVTVLLRIASLRSSAKAPSGLPRGVYRIDGTGRFCCGVGARYIVDLGMCDQLRVRPIYERHS